MVIRWIAVLTVFIGLIAAVAVSGARTVGGALPRGAELLYKSYDTITRVYRADIERGIVVELRIPRIGTGHVWSADGEQIAFVSTDGGDSDIFVMDALGHNIRNLTNNDVADYSPIWSPDGKWIAYASVGVVGRGATDIYVIGSDGNTPPRNISGTHGSASAPHWSPDSQQIAFMFAERGIRTTHIAALDSETEMFPPLYPDMTVFEWRWSPDGSRAAFVGIDDPTQLGAVQRIFIISVADDAVSPLLNPTDEHSSAYDMPAWSPDGTRIAYTAVQRVTSDIFIIDVDGDTPPSRLTALPSNERFPTWSPDGKWIAFTSGDNQYSEIYVIEVETGRTIRLTRDRVGDFAPLWRPKGA